MIAGAVGVLTGVEHMLSARQSGKPRKPRAEAAPSAVPAVRSCCFKIRQTRSEVGYVYWVLQGFGKHRCYVLHDTWQEAMDDAAARMKAAAEQHELVPVMV